MEELIAIYLSPEREGIIFDDSSDVYQSCSYCISQSNPQCEGMYNSSATRTDQLNLMLVPLDIKNFAITNKVPIFLFAMKHTGKVIRQYHAEFRGFYELWGVVCIYGNNSFYYFEPSQLNQQYIYNIKIQLEFIHSNSVINFQNMSYSTSKFSSYLRSPYTAPSTDSSRWKSTPLIGISLIERMPYERYNEHVPESKIEYMPIEKRYRDYLQDRKYFQDRYNNVVAVPRLERKEQIFPLEYYQDTLNYIPFQRQSVFSRFNY
ncbi:unnamed protein product (macronuclear) [Paramecium tetraurelia]|uniref:Uncharacterized protein n=1 Tax=Paramecium tetraurelia TaxID=5888 RepID=A0C3B2_PARTE|nr:uncharacterized protein GSPATT00034758001 [Paramecium tetraurelia]CAK65279.1 unnamed protein product [Paramecium tetraurelia]|eukprot:XP_001432676.1 hypothetical protein (macronuclear) [Paramecium tetraurelia strain d4-2]